MNAASSPIDGFFRAVLHCVLKKKKKKKKKKQKKQKVERNAFVVWRQTANCHKLVSICRGFLSVFRVVKDVLVLEANSFSKSQGSFLLHSIQKPNGFIWSPQVAAIIFFFA